MSGIVRRICAVTALTALCSAGFAGEHAGTAISDAEAASVLARLRARYAPQFDRYRGIESTRTVLLREYDTAANRMLHESRIRLVRRDYFYLKPQVTTLGYEKDGAALRPSDYRPRIEDPMLPVFDKNGETNYRITVSGYAIMGGVRCYRVMVEPMMATPRHFRGALFYRIDNLDPVFIEGTMAKLATGVKSYRMGLRMTLVGGVPAIASGTITIMVDVALIYPNRKFVSEIAVSDIKLIR